MINFWPSELDTKIVDQIIDIALEEDIGHGDLTSKAVITPETIFTGAMSAREEMVCAGLPIAGRIFTRYSKDIIWEADVIDGEKVAGNTTLARISGPAIDLLTAERTAINILQYLSGIATLTREYVEAISDMDTILLDTRKTTPVYRHLAKYATRMGGATNHRMALDDGVLIKDNHIAVAGNITEAVRRAQKAKLKKIEVECDNLDQVKDAVKAGADMILLDNMTANQMKEAVELVNGKIPTEASGDIDIDTIRTKAATGVTYLSVGRLTHSAPAVNIGLDWSHRV